MTTTDTVPTPRPPRPKLPDPKRYWSLAVIAVAQLMIVLDASVVIVALPVGPAGPAHLGRQPAVGHRRLHPGLRQPAAPGRSDRRLPRTPAHVHHRADRFRGRFGPRRPGPGPGHAVRGPGPAGCVRRRDGAGGPVAAHRDLHRAPRAGPGLRRLRRHRRRRSRHRARAGRDADPAGVVALDAAHQRAHRAGGGGGGEPGRPREQGRVEGRLRPPRRGDGHRRAVPPRLRLHRGRHPRVGGAAHHRPARRRRCPHGRVRRHRAAHRRTRCSPCG